MDFICVVYMVDACGVREPRRNAGIRQESKATSMDPLVAVGEEDWPVAVFVLLQLRHFPVLLLGALQAERC